MTDTQLRSGGASIPDVYMVSADQVTIIGNGTSQDPLRAGPGSSGGTFQAGWRGDPPPAAVGIPVFIAFFDVPGGITTVQPTDVRASPPNPAVSFAVADGLVVGVNLDGSVQVQNSGLVILTADQWDAATGDTGGLVLGHTYFPAIQPDFGLTDTPPTDPGLYRTVVGVGLNATTMLLTLAQPEQVLGDFLYYASITGPDPVVGTAVVADSGAGDVTPAVNSGSIPAATAIGLIVAYFQPGSPIVQTSGKVTLTTAEWDAVTGGSGGLTPGAPYYVSGTTGHLTSSRPGTPPVIVSLVGVALSETVLLLATPSVPLPLV